MLELLHGSELGVEIGGLLVPDGSPPRLSEDLDGGGNDASPPALVQEARPLGLHQVGQLDLGFGGQPFVDGTAESGRDRNTSSVAISSLEQTHSSMLFRRWGRLIRTNCSLLLLLEALAGFFEHSAPLTGTDVRTNIRLF